MPLVYGDYHSWNLAYLDEERLNVPFHLHKEGVEIHLGYSPMHGYTIHGECYAEVGNFAEASRAFRRASKLRAESHKPFLKATYQF